MAEIQYTIGTVHKTNQGCEYIILGRVGSILRIKFLDEYGYECNVTVSNACVGNIRNPYVITAYGKGSYGDINNLNVHQKEKKRWNNLLKSKMQYPPHWNCLELFVKDLRAMNIKNYQEWLESEDSKIKLLAITEDGTVIGFEVTERNPKTKRIAIKCMYNGEVKEYSNALEASIDTGYCMDTIRKYCTLQMIVDGFQYYYI